MLTNDTDVDIANEGDSLVIYSTSEVDNGTVTIAADKQSLTFEPADDFYGTETFAYTIHDSHDAADTAYVRVTVTAVNDAPVIADIANQTIAEDSNTGALSLPVSDVDDAFSALTITAASSNTSIIPNSAIVVGGSGNARTVTVTPLANKNTWGDSSAAHSPVTITLTLSDGKLATVDTFTVTVTPVNDPPDAVNDSSALSEDGSKTLLVLSNDTDVDLDNEGDNLLITAVSNVDNATVTITDGGKSLLFKPDSNWNGAETFNYTLQDEGGLSDTAEVSVTVDAVNDNPDAVDDTVTMDEDDSLEIDVLDNDSDVDIYQEGDTLTIVSYSGVDNGTVAIAEDGKTLTFTPAPNWSGSEEFSYTINDTHSGSDSAIVRVSVAAVADNPEANEDAYDLIEDAAVTSLNVLGNDTDNDLAFGDALQINAITVDASHGTVTIDTVNRRILYTPDANYNGSDSFTYQIRDNQTPAVYDTAVVNLTIAAVNDLPVVTSTNTHTIEEDHTASGAVTASDVDNGDSPDPDSQTFTVSTAAGHGSVDLNAASGAYTYTPNANYNGSDAFVVLVSDEHGGTASQTVMITVTAVNDVPTASNASYNTPEDVPVSKTIAASDPDVATNGDKLTFAVTSAPGHGTLELNATSGAFTYTPVTNYNGADAFSVKVSDKSGAQATATVNIYINYYENDPVANADAYTIDEDSDTVSFDVMDNDEDADLPYGDELHLTAITSTPAHGSASINPETLEVEYKPIVNYCGSDSFTYQIKDNQDPAAYASATVSILVTSINDAPKINSAALKNVTEDQQLSGSVTFEDVDLADIPVTDSHLYYTDAGPQHGQLALNQFTGEYLYTPTANYNGSDNFTIRVTDAHEASDSQVITVTVLWADDDPIAKDDTYTTKEGANWKTLDVVENDSDADLVYGDALTITRIITEPTRGTVQISATTNTLRYKPKGGYHGTDTFTYEIRDNQDPEKTASATVTVKIQKVEENDSSAGFDWESWLDEYNRNNGFGDGGNGKSDSRLLEDKPYTASVGIVGDSYSLDPQHEPANGTVTFDSLTGEFTYTPDENFNGAESFTILIQRDGRTISHEIELLIDP